MSLRKASSDQYTEKEILEAIFRKLEQIRRLLDERLPQKVA